MAENGIVRGTLIKSYEFQCLGIVPVDPPDGNSNVSGIPSISFAFIRTVLKETSLSPGN